MDSINQACTFTGHRAEKLPWKNDENDPRCLQLKEQIEQAVESVYHSGATHFICGMATGCDLYFCEAVIQLRAAHSEVTLEAAIPWQEQAASWPEVLRQRYTRLVADCDYYTLVQKSFTPDCLMRRNRYMVDHASVLIAAYAGKPGGTRNTLLYALRRGLKIIELPIE